MLNVGTGEERLWREVNWCIVAVGCGQRETQRCFMVNSGGVGGNFDAGGVCAPDCEVTVPGRSPGRTVKKCTNRFCTGSNY